MSDFLLKKWYLDIADEKGNVYIGYWACLKWGKLKIDGSHHLRRSDRKGIETQIELIKETPPKRAPKNQLIWQTNKLKASWRSGNKSIKEVLFSSPRGKIIWQCIQPKSFANIESSNLSFSGQGYAERIDITLPIWDLPFNTLYWGRCHTDNHYLVWIKWSGKTDQSLVYFDNNRSCDFKIKKNKIIGDGFCLAIRENFPLRQGKICSTIFGRFGKIIEFFPEKTFLAHESKWYGRGTLHMPAGEESATIIYEKVVW